MVAPATEEDKIVIKLSHFICLSHNSGAERIYFPVLPEALELKKKGNGENFNILGIGEITVLHTRELAEISFQSFFPASKQVPYLSIHPGLVRVPQYYIDSINKWQESKYPSRIEVKAPNFSLTIPVSIAQFDRREVAGSGGDIEFKLTLKEYRFFAPQKIKMETDENGNPVLRQEPPPRLDERVPATTYTVKAGDNLTKIARLMYNLDSARHKDIMEANNIGWHEVKTLQIGRVLKIPRP